MCRLTLGEEGGAIQGASSRGAMMIGRDAVRPRMLLGRDRQGALRATYLPLTI